MIRLLLISVLLLLPLPVSAESPNRKAIEKCYAKASLAAKLKFVYGLFCHRAIGFELFDQQGQQQDLASEQFNFQSLFDRAESVRLTTIVLDSRQLGRFTECKVEQTFEFKGLSATSDGHSELSYTTVSLDLWEDWTGSWRLRASKVVKQQVHR